MENLVGIKDSSCNMTKFIQELRLVGDRIAVLQGSEYLFVPSLLMGAPGGVLGVASACPKFTVQIYEAFVRGDIRKAVEMQMKLVNLLDQLTKHDFYQATKQAIGMHNIPFGLPRKPTDPKRKDEEIREVLSKFYEQIG
jgi:dihydrodipicolinate synthase/N-acetylneuraminate lyase